MRRANVAPAHLDELLGGLVCQQDVADDVLLGYLTDFDVLVQLFLHQVRQNVAVRTYATPSGLLEVAQNAVQRRSGSGLQKRDAK